MTDEPTAAEIARTQRLLAERNRPHHDNPAFVRQFLLDRPVAREALRLIMLAEAAQGGERLT